MADGPAPKSLFISRAGEDKDVALVIDHVLRKAGFETFLQDKDFGHVSFMARMEEGFKKVEAGGRLVALLSQKYQSKDHCLKEAHFPLIDDPSNKRQRLIILRISETAPDGFLKDIPYVDLVPLLHDADALARAVRGAVAPERSQPEADFAALYRRSAKQIVHPEFRPIKSFAGRKEDLARLETALWTDGAAALTQTAAVSGLGGIGKSMLAREYGWRNRARYRGIWWLAAESPSSLLAGLVELGGHFIVGIADMADRQKAARLTLDHISQDQAEEPWLLVYDNVETPRTIEMLMPTQRAHVLITSRWTEWFGMARALPVDVFPLDVATEFLLRRANSKDASGALRLAKALGCLPLALEHAGSYCASTHAKFDAYVIGLSELIKHKPHVGSYPQSVFLTFSVAVERAAQTAPEAERLLSLFSFVAPEDIPLSLIDNHVMSDLERGEAVAALGELSLLSWIDGERDDETPAVNIHRLVQQVMRERLIDLGHYPQIAAEALDIVWRAFPATSPTPDDHGAWRTSDRLAPHVAALLARVRDLSRSDAKLNELARRLGAYIEAKAAHDLATPEDRQAAVLLESIAAESGRRAHRTRGRAEIENVSAGAATEREAVLRARLGAAEETHAPNHPSVADLSTELAIVLEEQGRADEAEPLLRRAILIKLGLLGAEHPDVGTALGHLAQLLQSMGRLDEAKSYYEQAIAILEKAFGPTHASVGSMLNNLASLYQEQKRYDRAESLTRRALEIMEKNFGAEHPQVATSLNNLAILLSDMNRKREAEVLMRRALDITARTDSARPRHAASLSNLGTVLRDEGRLPEAEELFRRSLMIAERSLGAEHPDVALRLNNLAQILAHSGRATEAHALYQQALRILKGAYGERHPETVTVEENLRALEKAMGRERGKAPPAHPR